MANSEHNKTKAPQARADEFAASRFGRYCLILALVGAVALLWLSMLTFEPTDPPSSAVYPPTRPVDNAGGLVGAYIAHFLRYWLGGGVYMGLFFATVAAFVMTLGGRVSDLRWRVIGIALLIVATSSAVYVLNPSIADDVSRGLAGVLGIATGRFLLARFAQVGAWIIICVTLCIGVMLTADNLVLQIPRIGKNLWKRRGELPSVMGALRLGQVSPATNASAVASPRAAKAAPAAVQRLRPTLNPPRPAQPPRRPAKPAAEKGAEAYKLPSSDLLAEPGTGYFESQEAHALEQLAVLQQTLDDFDVSAQVVGHMTGPVITLFELSLAPGVKVAQVASLSTDISRALAVPGVRIVSPIPGKDTVGIEVPNMDKEIVRVKELMTMVPHADSDMYLPLYLGKDAGGGAIVADLAGMPHMLIAGTTGSGKSVCINAIIMSMLMTRTPEEVRLILVDPKMVEMAAFEKLPHLLCPIVNDMRKAEEILEWAATKMDERYELLKEAQVKNMAGYNSLTAEQLWERFEADSDEERARIPTRMAHYVIIIDELADLMMTSSKEVESHIIRIAQKARAVGIHLVLATQRPSVNVVTGLIKSNMPCRISFRVASRQESRIVLDQNGAEVLLGQGDMLFLQPGTSNLIRAQGTFVDESEIRAVLKELRRTSGRAQYDEEIMRLNARPAGEFDGQRDELFNDAVEIVLNSQRGSVSLLQRRLQVGYSRASRIIDQMADAGILGDYKGSQARECMMTLEDWQALKESIAADQSGQSALNGEPTSV